MSRAERWKLVKTVAGHLVARFLALTAGLGFARDVAMLASRNHWHLNAEAIWYTAWAFVMFRALGRACDLPVTKSFTEIYESKKGQSG